MNENLLSLLDKIKYNIVTLNVIHNDALISSVMVMYCREYEEENELLREKYEKYLHLWDGSTNHVHISKKVLEDYKLTRIDNDIHYIFEYRI